MRLTGTGQFHDKFRQHSVKWAWGEVKSWQLAIAQSVWSCSRVLDSEGWIPIPRHDDLVPATIHLHLREKTTKLRKTIVLLPSASRKAGRFPRFPPRFPRRFPGRRGRGN